MNKKLVTIEQLEEGMTLAEKVENNHGAVLISAGTILSHQLINKLEKLRISHISIYTGDEQPDFDIDKQMDKIKYNDQRKKIKNIFNCIQKKNKIDHELIKDMVVKSMKLDNNLDIIKLLTHIHEKDEYTYNHSVNVGLMSMLFGRWLNLENSEVKKLTYAGFLHDVGKAKVPDEILNKKGSLTNEEFEIMQKHSISGYKLIKDCMYISDRVARAVLLHHERKDGSGYPLGIKGSRVPFFARVISIVDTFDAMTSDRVYSQHQVPFEVLKKLNRDSLQIFDIVLLNTFTKNIINYYKGEKVKLSDGTIGELVYIKHDIPTEPIIKVEDHYIDLRKSDLYIEDIYTG